MPPHAHICPSCCAAFSLCAMMSEVGEDPGHLDTTRCLKLPTLRATPSDPSRPVNSGLPTARVQGVLPLVRDAACPAPFSLSLCQDPLRKFPPRPCPRRPDAVPVPLPFGVFEDKDATLFCFAPHLLTQCLAQGIRKEGGGAGGERESGRDASQVHMYWFLSCVILLLFGDMVGEEETDF